MSFPGFNAPGSGFQLPTNPGFNITPTQNPDRGITIPSPQNPDRGFTIPPPQNPGSGFNIPDQKMWVRPQIPKDCPPNVPIEIKIPGGGNIIRPL